MPPRCVRGRRPVLRTLPTDVKDAALAAMADALVERTDEVLAANAADVEAAAADGTPESVLDRLRLDAARVAGSPTRSGGSSLPDPVGDVVRGSRLPNGLQLRQVRVPFGVVGIVYEARPNVTVDAAGLCLKSGNAALLRGSASAFRTNTALVAVLTETARRPGCPRARWSCCGRPRVGGRAAQRPRGLVDVVIPRGGASLIERVVRESTVPVIETGVGNCHVYVDASADPAMAEAIVLNSKTHRVSVCNAARRCSCTATSRSCRACCSAWPTPRSTLHGDSRRRPRLRRRPGDRRDGRRSTCRWTWPCASSTTCRPRSSTSRGGERAQRGDRRRLAAAIADVHRGVDAAAVLVNASTRFTDGGEFGFGAEIGISTQKLHARGPLGLPELTSPTS